MAELKHQIERGNIVATLQKPYGLRIHANFTGSALVD